MRLHTVACCCMVFRRMAPQGVPSACGGAYMRQLTGRCSCCLRPSAHRLGSLRVCGYAACAVWAEGRLTCVRCAPWGAGRLRRCPPGGEGRSRGSAAKKKPRQLQAARWQARRQRVATGPGQEHERRQAPLDCIGHQVTFVKGSSKGHKGCDLATSPNRGPVASLARFRHPAVSEDSQHAAGVPAGAARA